MKTKLRLLVGKGGLLIALVWMSPFPANAVTSLSDAERVFGSKIRDTIRRMEQSMNNFSKAFERAVKHEAALSKRNEELKRQLAEVQKQQKEQRAQQWQGQKQKAKNLWNKVNTPPEKYWNMFSHISDPEQRKQAAWKKYHRDRQQEQMNNSR